MEFEPPRTYRRGIVRGERGQTAAETLGALLIVSVIIAAMATTDAGAKIATESQRIVCEIAGGECAPSETQPGGPLEGFEYDGPPLAGQTLPVLPFPGTATVTCTVDSRQPETCVPKGQPGVSVIASGEIKIERTPTFLDMEGCPFQNLSIQTTLKFGANAEAKGAKIGGQVQAFLGRASKYQVTATPGNADAIEAGSRAAPNPVDPRSLAKGEAIQLNEDYFAGIKAKATYREYQLELGYDEGRRVSSGIKRMDAHTMRVMVGDEDFVKQALKLGVKLGDASLSVGNSKELSDGKLHAIDIDISTEAGWNAYQRFIATGKLPQPGTAATTNPTKAETVRYTDTTEFEAKFGPVTVGGRGSSSEGRYLKTENLATGTTTYSTNARYNDTSLTYAFEEDANGNPTGTPRYSLMLHDVHDSYIPMLYDRMGQKQPAGDPPKDIRIDFTEAELRELQELALTRIGERMSMDGDERPTNDEIRRSMQPDGTLDLDGATYALTGLQSMLASAKDPFEMLAALYRAGFNSPNMVIEDLAHLVAGSQYEFPGTINQPSC
jgi:hypothetical protein